jgi:hypothetical protein
MLAPCNRNARALLLAFTLLGCLPSAHAIPGFGRKYGLRCSSCHEAWPMLNAFGQKFKDNGYQLMNDRDSPIWQNPSYWPVTFRITPNWHRESNNKVAVDTPAGPDTGEQQITSTGFDVSGLDFHTAGTLDRNVSFYVLPSSDSTGAFHFETVMARFDNLTGSSWLNVKLGKFELDNLVSEKRILTLSNDGGFYQIYHFIPVGDGNIFGQIGDNQLGVEVMGHSVDDRTRYSAALISSNDGDVNLPDGANSYTGFFTFSKAFDSGKLGLQRIGAYAMVGEAATAYSTSTTDTGGIATTTPPVPVVSTSPIGGSGIGNKPFNREGFVGEFYLGKVDFQVVSQHGWDNAWFGAGYGQGLPGQNNLPGTTLPVGARSPSWNGGFVETHYLWNPQLILIQRSEWVRMSQQALVSMPSNLGNIDAYTFACRWYPIMTSRAGLAIHNEYSWVRQIGTAPVTNTDLESSSLMIGVDFAF